MDNDRRGGRWVGAVLFALAAGGCGQGGEPSHALETEASLEGSAFYAPLVDDVSASRLRRHVEILSGACTPHVKGDRFGTCDPIAENATAPITRWAQINHSRERLLATTDYIREAFVEAAGPAGRLRVFEQEIAAGFTYPQKNVIAVLPGWDATAPAVIVSAHHDAVNPQCWGAAGCNNWSDPLLGNNARAPGANDNAAGVAVLIEVATRLQAARPRGSIVFIAFAAEEAGRIGSQAYVARLPSACSDSTSRTSDELMFPCRSRIRGVINLDIVGLPRRTLGGEAVVAELNAESGRREDTYARLYAAARVGPNDLEPGDTSSQHLGRSLGLAIGSYADTVESFGVWQRPALDRPNRYSDHQTFSDLGIPAVRLIASRDSDVNHSWHDRVLDRQGRDMIDWSYVARMARITLIGAHTLADGPVPPSGLRLNAANEAEWDAPSTSTRFVVAFRSARSITVTNQIVASRRIVVPADARSVSVASIDARGIVGPLSEQLYVRECPTDAEPGGVASGEAHHCSDDL